jgi:FlaA1/EpsC-like NDP-sugar epimerase
VAVVLSAPNFARAIAPGARRLLIIEKFRARITYRSRIPPPKADAVVIEGRLADIRTAKRVFEVIRTFRPDLVLHAASVEARPAFWSRDRSEDIKTNVFGSINVADAAVEAGARGMVMISTDKAIEAVSVLGVTKRPCRGCIVRRRVPSLLGSRVMASRPRG